MADVPRVPGVPALASYAANNVALLAADVVTVLGFLAGPQWGIFAADGSPAFTYNSVVDVDFKQDYPVSDYPVEEGGFQSYDKVELPFDVRVRLTSGGTEQQREALLTSVFAAKKTLDLYDVVTPEQVYAGCNVTHVSFRRSAENGVGMILIDVWFVEVRETAAATFSNTQTPVLAGRQNTGNVAGQPVGRQVDQGFDSGALVPR